MTCHSFTTLALWHGLPLSWCHLHILAEMLTEQHSWLECQCNHENSCTFDMFQYTRFPITCCSPHHNPTILNLCCRYYTLVQKRCTRSSAHNDRSVILKHVEPTLIGQQNRRSVNPCSISMFPSKGQVLFSVCWCQKRLLDHPIVIQSNCLQPASHCLS
jgi:hypothetical protein